jgi:hypothetical protein
MIKLTPEQRSRLRAVGRKPNHPDCGKENIALDELLDKLRMETPSAFLAPEELSKRIFMICPTGNVKGGFMFTSIQEIA